MNIQQAKDHIKNAVKIYLKKDEFGDYRIPLVRQRPLFLLGEPGIGKTAVMEQIAQELGIALVSYSMTHHTRQSALGLPFIVHKEYEDMECDVSEYTMSEIIASIYDVMEESGVKEGILFLDEINCVSETLAPSMLQFLQYKIFGRHKIPDGWVVVTAGNPPEYNKSVREFDVVTLDRLKVLEIEADYDVWRKYAVNKGLHNAIITYLDIKKDDFYLVETTVRGKSYVTARGWEDLSETMQLCEEEGIVVDESVIEQIIRNDKIAKEFAAYYDLYNKYKEDYKVDEILEGKVTEDIKNRGRGAAFDERLSLLGLLIDKLQGEIHDNIAKADYLKEVMKPLKEVKAASEQADRQLIDILEAKIEQINKIMDSLKKANNLSDSKRHEYKSVIQFLNKVEADMRSSGKLSGTEGFLCCKTAFDAEVAKMKEENAKIQKRLHHVFAFVEESFGAQNEILILVTELTVNMDCARFISTYGCEDYHKHNKELMLHDRQKDLLQEIENLDL